MTFFARGGKAKVLAKMGSKGVQDPYVVLLAPERARRV